MLQTTGYDPQFFTTKVRAILDDANISPDSVVKIKSGNKVRLVSPLGHSEGSMSAAVDFCILRGITEPAEIIKALDNDPVIIEQRKRFLRLGKETITIKDLLAKIDGHILYYTRKNFDSFFTKTFQTDPSVVRSIRKAAKAYMENTWKPGLKSYKQALSVACVAVAEEVVKEEHGAIALEQEVSSSLIEVPQQTVEADLSEVAITVAEKRVCTALTKAGVPCKGFALDGKDTCRVHTPKE